MTPPTATSGNRNTRLPPRRPRAMLATLAVAAATTLALVGAAPPAAADDIRDQQWHLDYLDIGEAHQTTQGQGVTVAVIDTGVQADHPDLRNNVVEGADLIGDTDGRTDKQGHGTGMASLIAGHGHGRSAGILGIAPQAEILPIRVGERAQGENIAEGIRLATDRGAQVINVSLGQGTDEPELREAAGYAQANNAVIIASPGNPFAGSYIVNHPASYPGVVAVSAVGRSGEFDSDVSIDGQEIDLAAPGVDVMYATNGNGYSIGRGTSASAAIVSGVAALVRAQYPDLDAANVINRLVQTADDKGPDGRDPQYGFGVVDPTQALNADIPQTPTNPLGTLTEQTPTPDQTPADTPTSQTAPPPPDNTTNTTLLLTAAGIGILALAVVAISAIALARTRRRPANPTGPHPPTASGPQPPPAPPPGPRPHPPPNQPGPPNQPPPRRPPPPPPPTGR